MDNLENGRKIFTNLLSGKKISWSDFLLLRQGLTVQPQLFWNSVYSPSSPQTYDPKKYRYGQ